MTTNNTTNSAIRRGERAAVGSDTRGASEVLGAILIFALVLMLIVLFQVTLVPSLNKTAEFDHNERVQGDMEALQANLLSASTTGAPADMTVETGVRYPERAFLLNPPPVAGEFSTHPGSITLDGFSSTDPETADFWNGSAMAPYETRSLSYVVEYNEYRTPPRTVYEYSTLYNRFGDDTVLPLGNGKLISGNRISLVVLEGDISEASTRSLTSRLDPVSAPATTTVLSGDGVDPTITLTSTLSKDKWEAILAEEMNESVKSVSKSGDVVTITLFADEPYKVRMTKIGIGSGYDATQTPAYIRTADAHNATIGPSEKHQVVFEVLDEFNNPVSGVEVTPNVDPALGRLETVRNITDVEGRAVFEFTGGKEGGVVEITGTIDGVVAPMNEASATITVKDLSLGSGSDSTGARTFNLNPANPDEDVILNESFRTNEERSNITLLFENRNLPAQTIEEVRINFYYSGSPGQDDYPDYFQLIDESGTSLLESGRSEIQNHFEPLDPANSITVEQPGPTKLYVVFERLEEKNNKPDSIEYISNSTEDDFFVLTVLFGDGRTSVYLVSSPSS